MATVTQQERTDILKLVAGMFNAAPGKDFLNEFTDAYVAGGRDMGRLAEGFGQTGAFQSVYPSFLTTEEFANKFLATLGLQSNAVAQDFVKAHVNAGESFATVIYQTLVALVGTTEAEYAAARDQLANKAAVAEYYSVTKGYSSGDLATLQAVVAGVTDDPKTVTAAENAIVDPVTPGQTYTLTTAAGEKIVATAGNDEIRGVAGASAEADRTLNIGDTIDGGAGTDTLNLTITGPSAVPAGVEVKNVEIVNLNVGSSQAGSSFLTSSLYSGVEQLWQISKGVNKASVGTVAVAASETVAAGQVAGNGFANVVVGDGVTAGFQGSGLAGSAAAVLVNAASVASSAAAQTATVTYTGALEVKAATAAQKVISVALDGVGSSSSIKVAAEGSGKIETVNVSGSIAKASSTTDGAFNLSLENANTKTLNGEFTSGLKLSLYNKDALATIDLSKSTGGIDLADSLDTLIKLGSLVAGSGNDKVKLESSGAASVAVDLTVDLGAGNDTFTLNGGSATIASGAVSATTDKEVSVTLGAGKDTVKVVDFVNNIKNVDAIDTNGLLTVADFSLADDSLVLQSGKYQALTTEQIDQSAAASLKAAANAAIVAATAASKNTTIFQYGEDAYVVVDSAQDAAGNMGTFSNGDGLIKLAGVNAADLVASATAFVLV